TVNNFVAYADCHTTEEAGVNLRVDGHRTTINLAQLLGEYCLLAFIEFTRTNNVCDSASLQLCCFGRLIRNPLDDIANLAAEAAQLQGRTVAHVVSAGELNEGQQAVLSEEAGVNLRVDGHRTTIQ